MDSSTAISTPGPGLLINRSFGLLWTGQAISNLGDFVFDTTLVLWIATQIGRGQPWAPAAVSGVLIATFAPTFLVGPVAGVFVDRWNKRRTMLIMDALRAVLILLLVPISVPVVAHHIPVLARIAAIFTVVFLTTACSQFFAPARMALVGDVVDEPYRARAGGLSQATQSLATIIGPPLAAPIMIRFGTEWTLLIDALSFAISFVLVSLIHAPRATTSLSEGEKPDFRREMVAGLRYVWQTRLLRAVLITGVLIMLGAGALNALDVFFVTQNLHAGASVYGLVSASLGFGMLAGAVLAGAMAQRFGVVRTFWASALAAGTLLLIYSRLTSLAPAIVLLFVLGIPAAAINVAMGPILLNSTPKELVGRVTSVFNPAVSLASILSIAVAGYLDSTILNGFHASLLGLTFGPVDTIFTGAGMLGLAGGLYAMGSMRSDSAVEDHDSTALPAEELLA
jgi:MFS family permease